MNNLTKNTKTFAIVLFLSIIMLLMSPILIINSNATDEIPPISSYDLIDESNTSNTNEMLTPDNIVPSVPMETAMNHLEGKVFDVVKLLQTIGKPICIVMFIACVLVTIVGAIGKGGYVAKGIIGMLICGVSYTCILFAPQIVAFFSSWLSS